MTQETRNAIKALKEVILSSNPNPRYGDMIRALNELEATLPEEEVIVAKLEEVTESVPPRVKLPEDVTVPLSESPLTVPVPPTEVTVPVLAVAPAAIPSNLVA
jgi:hypothetical protein